MMRQFRSYRRPVTLLAAVLSLWCVATGASSLPSPALMAAGRASSGPGHIVVAATDARHPPAEIDHPALAAAVPDSSPAQWATLAREDFEGAFPSAGWQLLTNTDGYAWGRRDCRAHAGGHSGWGHGGGDVGEALACDTDYPDDLETWLVYGPFSLANATAAEVGLWFWRDTEPDADRLQWRLSTDGGYALYVPGGAVPTYADGRDGTVQFSVETGLRLGQLPEPPPSSERILTDVAKFGPDGFTFAWPVDTTLPLQEVGLPEPYRLLRYRPELSAWRLQPYALTGSGSESAISASTYDVGYTTVGYADPPAPVSLASALSLATLDSAVQVGPAAAPGDAWASGCFVFHPGTPGVCPFGVGAMQGCHYYLTVINFTPKYPQVTGPGGWVMDWANFRTGSQPDSSPQRAYDTIFFAPQGTYNFCVTASEWVVPGGFLPLPGKWTYSLPLSVNLNAPCRNNRMSIDTGNARIWDGRVDAPLPTGGTWGAPPVQCPVVPPTPTAPYGTGEFQATLTWVNTDTAATDLDLHLRGPGGMHVYYDAPQSSDRSLELDRDMSRGGVGGDYDMGPNIENIYSLKAMAKGDYALSVILYYGHANSFGVRTIHSGRVMTYQHSLLSRDQEIVIERFTVR